MSPPAAPLKVGDWTFRHQPDGWDRVGGLGLRLTKKDHFPSSVVVVADELTEAETLAAYVERQLATMRRVLTVLEVEGPRPAERPRVEEALELVVRHSIEAHLPMVQRQLYLRRGGSVAIVTATTRAADESALRKTFQDVFDGLTPPETG
jgi:hypothetical protein